MKPSFAFLFWLVVGLLFLIVEIRKVLKMTQSKQAIWTISAISILGLAGTILIAYLTGSLWLSSIVFFLINFLGREWFVRISRSARALQTQPYPSTEIFFKGREGMVIEKIDPKTGRGLVIVDGLVRKARTLDNFEIPERQTVRVVGLTKKTVSIFKMLPAFGIAEEEILIVQPIPWRKV